MVKKAILCCALKSPFLFVFQKKKPKRPCYYCGEEQSQLVRHLTRKHKMEDAVVAALKLPKMEQRRAFEKIRKDGIFKMNVSLM